MIRALVVAGLVVIASAGCAEDIETPERFGALTGHGDDGPCIAEILLVERCGDCHDDRRHFGDLDLVTADPRERLLGAPSAGCPGETLLVDGDVEGSYFYKKLHGAPPCGDQMPATSQHLSAQEIECIANWLVEAP